MLDLFYQKEMGKLKSNKEFIQEAMKVHGELYDYSTTKYINAKTKVVIKCKIHGDFIQSPRTHLRGQGCRLCGIDARVKNSIIPFKVFEEKAFTIHNNFYSYNESSYVSLGKNMEIICPTHGSFTQKPEKHLMGRGCMKCAGNFPLTLDDFKKRADKVHRNSYDYTTSEYNGINHPIDIICKAHGKFSQQAAAHLKGSKCPKCAHSISVSEDEIVKIIESMGLNVIVRNRKIIKPYELDIYIPELNKAIEFNGTYWHYSEKHFIPGKHGLKSKLCRQKGIKLLHVREDLWLINKEKMKNIIKNFLNL